MFVPSIAKTLNRRKTKDRLFKAMERYWINYSNGKTRGKQAPQVAPIWAYRKRYEHVSQRIKKQLLKAQTPLDQWWVKDPEGVMLGKYDF